MRRDPVTGRYRYEGQWLTPREIAEIAALPHVINGEAKSLTAWAREYGLPPEVVRDRVRLHHWTLEKAPTTPVGPSRFRKKTATGG
jgi:hypothetical protein